MKSVLRTLPLLLALSLLAGCVVPDYRYSGHGGGYYYGDDAYRGSGAVVYGSVAPYPYYGYGYGYGGGYYGGYGYGATVYYGRGFRDRDGRHDRRPRHDRRGAHDRDGHRHRGEGGYSYRGRSRQDHSSASRVPRSDPRVGTRRSEPRARRGNFPRAPHRHKD